MKQLKYFSLIWNKILNNMNDIIKASKWTDCAIENKSLDVWRKQGSYASMTILVPQENWPSLVSYYTSYIFDPLFYFEMF